MYVLMQYLCIHNPWLGQLHNLPYCLLVDNASELLVSLSSGNLEDFYPSAAIASLMKILKDPSLSQHHTMVIQVTTACDRQMIGHCYCNCYIICYCIVCVQALTFIFKSLGIKSVPFLPQVHIYIVLCFQEYFYKRTISRFYYHYRLCQRFSVP